MTLNEYQERAMSFRLPTARTEYVVLNLASEVGELFGHFAKAIRDGTPANYDELLKKELGDILWSVAGIAEDMDWSLDDVAQANVGKLQSRKDRGVIQGSGDNR
jgi:NTP pyrophosphatase (non-canonical NTP hydrolase)